MDVDKSASLSLFLLRSERNDTNALIFLEFLLASEANFRAILMKSQLAYPFASTLFRASLKNPKSFVAAYRKLRQEFITVSEVNSHGQSTTQNESWHSLLKLVENYLGISSYPPSELAAESNDDEKRLSNGKRKREEDGSMDSCAKQLLSSQFCGDSSISLCERFKGDEKSMKSLLLSLILCDDDMAHVAFEQNLVNFSIWHEENYLIEAWMRILIGTLQELTISIAIKQQSFRFYHGLLVDSIIKFAQCVDLSLLLELTFFLHGGKSRSNVTTNIEPSTTTAESTTTSTQSPILFSPGDSSSNSVQSVHYHHLHSHVGQVLLESVILVSSWEAKRQSFVFVLSEAVSMSERAREACYSEWLAVFVNADRPMNVANALNFFRML
jgi:hypothetical protein